MAESYSIREGILESYTGREEVFVVPREVHTIGKGAFKACTSLKKIVLPLGLRCIMDEAMKGCRKLEEIEIPQGVSYIGNYAFHRCHALKQVILPASVETLGDCVFLYCDSLVTVKIPGVKKLGKQVFVNDVLLETIEISEDLEEECICDVFTGCGRITQISFAGGRCFQITNAVEVIAGKMQVPSLIYQIAADILRMMELDGRCLIRFLTNLKHVEIPEGIESLANSCFFDKRGILTVTFPKSLKKIGSRAFRNCINLEEVRFEGKQVQIQDDAFKNCTALKLVKTWDKKEYFFSGISQLRGKDIPEMVQTIQKQVIGNFRISGTMLLKYLGEESRVVIPEEITRIAQEAFAGKEMIDRVILPESLEEIGAEAFRDCLLLQTIEFPNKLSRIGKGAFENCVKLIRVHLPDKIKKIEDRVFCRCRVLKEVSFSEGFEEIGESAFYGCDAIKKIQFPESLLYIGEMAFYQCKNLKEVRLPAKTEYIKSLAFAKSGVQKVWIAGSGKNYGRDVFSYCTKLKMLVLEEGVKHIPDKLAFECTILEKVKLPKSVSSVGKQVWDGTKFLERWIEKYEIPLKDKVENQDKILENKIENQKEEDIFWDGQKLEGEVILPENIKIVAGGAFYGNTKITQIILPDSVHWIGKSAFKGCKNLQKVIFPSQIIKIEAEVFSGCIKLEEIRIRNTEKVPEQLEKFKYLKETLEFRKDEYNRTEELEEEIPVWKAVGERAFYQCKKLQRLCLEQVEVIGKQAFAGCVSLEQSKVKNGLKIGEAAFEGADNWEKAAKDKILIVGGIVVSGNNCSFCSQEIDLPKGVVGIAPYAFAGNKKITKVKLPEGIKWIGEGAFFGCSNLLEIEFPKGLEEIGERVFEKCISLRQIETDAKQIGKAAFAFCIKLKKVQFSKVNRLSNEVLEGCECLESCICENTETVGEKSFCGCRKLKEFDFSKIISVNFHGFQECDSLQKVTFHKEVSLAAYAFQDCGKLEEIELLDNIKTISLREYAFSGCTALRMIKHQEKEWKLKNYQDIFTENFPEIVKLLFCSAFSCFEVQQEENISGYQGTGRIVKIPQGIRKIEAEVFRDMIMLEEVEIPKSVEYIGARAFHGTKWIKKQQKKNPLVVVNQMILDGSCCMGKVIVPEDIRFVCGWAFANGMGIEKIQFLGNQTKVEEYAFRNCIFLKQMEMPDGTSISFTGIQDREKELPALAKQAVMDSMNCFKTDKEGVLVECTGNISKLLIANGITAIGQGAFQESNLLTEIIVPITITKIEKSAFAGCKWLKEVKKAYGVEEIGEMAFWGCGILEKVELSEKFQKLGARAFEGCVSLEEIQIPEGIEEIPEKAFYRCHSLKRLKFPSTLKRIGKEAFAFCENLPEIVLPKGVIVEERAFLGL